MLSHPSLFQGSGDGPNVNQCQLILTNNTILVLGTSRVVRGCLQPLRTRRYSTNSRSSTRESRNSYPRRHLPPIHLTASSLLPRSRSCTRARRPKLHSHLDTHPALLVWGRSSAILGRQVLLGRQEKAHQKINYSERSSLRRISGGRAGHETTSRRVWGCETLSRGAYRHPGWLALLLWPNWPETASWQAKGYLRHLAEWRRLQCRRGYYQGVRE